MLRICLEEDVCLYRPNARWGGEFEWLKTLQGSQLEELQNIVESLGQKTLEKNCQNPLHHHMLFGRVSRKILLAHPKNKLQQIQLSDMTNFKWDWLLWSDETEKWAF